jgi:hypothetical protein
MIPVIYTGKEFHARLPSAIAVAFATHLKTAMRLLRSRIWRRSKA